MGGDNTSRLVDEALVHAADLSRDKFGHYVVQSVLEHGLPRQQKQVALSLLPILIRALKHPNLSYVIVAALKHCDEEVQKELISELERDPSCIRELTRRPFSRNVLKAVLKKDSFEDSKTILKRLKEYVAQLPDDTTRKRLEKEFAEWLKPQHEIAMLDIVALAATPG